jgi:hypothetical protein
VAWDPALGDQGGAGYVCTKSIQGVVDRLRLHHLEAPRLQRFRSCFQHALAMSISLDDDLTKPDFKNRQPNKKLKERF